MYRYRPLDSPRHHARHPGRAELHLTGWSELDVQAIDLAQAYRNAQLAVLGSILADHQRLARVAAECGVRRIHFEDDLHALFLAIHEARTGETIDVLDLARSRLIDAGYWDDTQLAEHLGAMWWSDRSLVRLARFWPVSVAAVQQNSRRLIQIHDDIQGRREAWRVLTAPIPHHKIHHIQNRRAAA